jgi:hypothetical protein
VKRRVGLPKRTGWIARSPVKRKATKPKTFAHSTHSRARQRFVCSLPCRVTGRTPSEGAHVLGVDGIGRKGHYTTIAPLHWRVHREFDVALRGQRFLDKYNLTEADLKRWAQETETAWQLARRR